MKHEIRYRGWYIRPCLGREYDLFEFAHDAYDGPGDNRHGTARTVEECCDEIDDRESEIEQ